MTLIMAAFHLGLPAEPSVGMLAHLVQLDVAKPLIMLLVTFVWQKPLLMALLWLSAVTNLNVYRESS